MINDSIIKKIPSVIPLYVYRVSDVLISNGFEAYLVGGSLRDILLGNIPKDFDIATNAKPAQIQKLFSKSVATGARFGTIMVLMEDENGERFAVEVTTYRSESDYFGGRWPGKVEFTDKIENDLSRRDFTINSIALNLENTNIENNLIQDRFVDPYGGVQDLNLKIIRAVGDPVERFSEDGLRPIRACRFASVLGFEIEENTFKAIKNCLNVVRMVALERVRDEFDKIILNSPVPSVGFRLLDKSGILDFYLPELLEAKNFYQPEYHSDNVFDHSLKAMDLAQDDIKWAALLHDIGKIKTKTEDEKGIHYYGHDIEGAKMAKEVLVRLKFPNREVERITNLIRWHMFHYPSAEWRKENEVTNTQVDEPDKNVHGWSDAAIRRFIKNVGGEEQIDQLIKLRIADATSNLKSSFSTDETEAFEKRIAKVRSEDMVLKLSDIALRGKDLKEMGYQEGPHYKKILNFLLENVIEDPLLNQKDILTNLVKENFPQKSL